MDVDGFLVKSKLNPYKKFYKGDPRYKSRPEGKKGEFSGCAIEVSNASFKDFVKQAEDAINYLETNKEKLSIIKETTGIDYSILDFGIDCNINNFTQTHSLPRRLLKLVSDLDIDIELSIYPTDS